jgi:AraC-like DNA-binding protein
MDRRRGLETFALKSAGGGPTPAASPSQGLIIAYAEAASAEAVRADPCLSAFADRQLAELAALVRAAPGRLDAKNALFDSIKRDIARRLPDPAMRLADIARRHRVSARYVQRLFETDGGSFTAYVLDARLQAARRLLVAEPARKISAIAYETGFSDVSWFNRVFRKRFGVPPSALRRTR